jgi:hypothetical protein
MYEPVDPKPAPAGKLAPNDIAATWGDPRPRLLRHSATAAYSVVGYRSD